MANTSEEEPPYLISVDVLSNHHVTVVDFIRLKNRPDHLVVNLGHLASRVDLPSRNTNMRSNSETTDAQKRTDGDSSSRLVFEYDVRLLFVQTDSNGLEFQLEKSTLLDDLSSVQEHDDLKPTRMTQTCSDR